MNTKDKTVQLARAITAWRSVRAVLSVARAETNVFSEDDEKLDRAHNTIDREVEHIERTLRKLSQEQ